MEEGSSGGPYRFGVVGIDRAGGDDDRVDTGCFSRAQDGAQIAGISTRCTVLRSGVVTGMATIARWGWGASVDATRSITPAARVATEPVVIGVVPGVTNSVMISQPAATASVIKTAPSTMKAP